MTASIKNTISSMKVLENALDAYEREPEELTDAELSFAFNIRNLLNSSRKCIESLFAQLKFHQGATNHGRALIDKDNNVIRGMAVETLHIPTPGTERDVVIYGRADALAFVAEALAAKGHQSNGPAPIEAIAAQLSS